MGGGWVKIWLACASCCAGYDERTNQPTDQSANQRWIIALHRCLPAAIQHRQDVVGAAQTGSGKTLAFAIPIVHALLTLYDQKRAARRAKRHHHHRSSAAAAAAAAPRNSSSILSATKRGRRSGGGGGGGGHKRKRTQKMQQRRRRQQQQQQFSEDADDEAGDTTAASESEATDLTGETERRKEGRKEGRSRLVYACACVYAVLLALLSQLLAQKLTISGRLHNTARSHTCVMLALVAFVVGGRACGGCALRWF